MGLIGPSNDKQAIERIVHRWLQGHGPVSSSLKKDIAAEENHHRGQRDGLAIALAQFMSVRKLAQYPYLTRQWIDEIGSWDVAKVLKQFQGEFDDAGGITSTTTPRADVVDKAVAALEELLYDESLTVESEINRRGLIRDGKLEPTAEDVDWIEKEYQSLQNEAKALGELKDRIDLPPILNKTIQYLTKSGVTQIDV